ncbi:integrase catalytic domain-containing protein [Trichonephila clavata]|uniref:Integrase catalytic domain-containing protein n=1 Tax=Trichonephila clavata TaxID=2740835 RepID=A0A8X6J4L4_TRICU|nr:integrase catalytic domain-containing protein [Trichonephila clavata]
MDTLKSLRTKLSDIRNEYYEVVLKDSDLEPLELEILDLEDDCEDIQLAIDDGDKYPLAADVIMSDVYMDDLLTGADDLESGRKLQEQLVSLLRGAGMELHKWSASNPLLLPDSMCQDKDLSYSSSTETKTLGLLWKPHPDSFAFKISPMTSNCDSLIVTKKSVISTIARIFDPLGLIGPVITRAKIFLQSLWQLKLDWNDPLPSNLVSYWKSFIDALESINCLNIPRYCLQDKSIRTELHGFSDSSEKAYGAALYLRCIDSSGQISVRLLCSKSKVAPLKSAEATLANIRNSFWIPSARNVVRKILRTASPVEKLVLKVRSN